MRRRSLATHPLMWKRAFLGGGLLLSGFTIGCQPEPPKPPPVPYVPEGGLQPLTRGGPVEQLAPDVGKIYPSKPKKSDDGPVNGANPPEETKAEEKSADEKKSEEKAEAEIKKDEPEKKPEPEPKGDASSSDALSSSQDSVVLNFGPPTVAQLPSNGAPSNEATTTVTSREVETELAAVTLSVDASSESQDRIGAKNEDSQGEKVKIRFQADGGAKTVKAEATSAIKGNSDPIPTKDLAVGDKRLPAGIEPSPLPQEPKKSTSSVVATEFEKNQKIAENWSKPWVALFITGQQHGYMEPCGCTGLENQKGGLNRRDTLLSQIVARGWDVLPIDAGNQVRRMGTQSEMKFLSTADAFKTMNYAAVSFGVDDLFLSPMQLFFPLTNVDGENKSPFVSANVVVVEKGAVDPWKVLPVAGRKIGITAVVGDSYKEKLQVVQCEDLKVLPALSSLREAAASLQKEACDIRILIAHATLEESASLAQEVPGFDLVVSAGGYGEPEDRPSMIPGTKTMMVHCGVKGMHAGLMGFYDDPKQPVRYQRIALSSQFEDSPRMIKQFVLYQEGLKAKGLTGLASSPLMHASGREFVGSERCGDCHSKAFEVWKGTGHAKSTDSLINPPERSEIQRHFDPECLSCHVTGWNLDSYKPFRSGYTSVEATPHMMQNGCENCHGPGSAHVEAEENSRDGKLLAKLREEMRLPLNQAEQHCQKCHDMDNSPDFHEAGAFEEYWEKVKHIGKD